MTWYRIGTVTVTNGSPNVTLAGGDALQNIFPDDGFVGPDGRTYAINTIGGAGAFTLQTSYQGATAAGAAYLIIPVADYVQLRDLLTAVNSLITQYQDITLKAGIGLFEPGNAAAPGVRGVGHEGTGIVWNGDESLSVSVAGTIVATFAVGGAATLLFPDGTVGTPGFRFANDTNTGIYRASNDAMRIVTGGVERLNVDENGNIGIGTNAPAAKFQVSRSGPGEAIRFGSAAYAMGYLGEEEATNTVVIGNRYPDAVNCNISFRVNGAAAETMRVAAAGVGIGVTPAARLHVKSSSEIMRLETTTVRGGGAAYFTIHDPTGRKGYVGYTGGAEDFYVNNEMTGTLNLQTGGDINFYSGGGLSFFATSSTLRPGADNARSLGHSSFRWSVVYAATNVINTSDEREKKWRGAPTKAELRAATRIISELGFFQWNDAVAEKGDNARLHFGPRAQRVWKIMAEEKLVAPITNGKPGKTAYAFLCFDEWDEQVESIIEERTIPAVYKGRGKDRKEVEPERIEKYDTGKTRTVQKAGDRFGIRTDQLIMFMIAAQQVMNEENDRRLTAIEERLNDGK